MTPDRTRAPASTVRSSAASAARLLDALSARHERAARRVYRLSGTAFEQACRAARRFCFLRDRLRVRLLTLRRGDSLRSEGLLSECFRVARANARFEGIVRTER